MLKWSAANNYLKLLMNIPIESNGLDTDQTAPIGTTEKSDGCCCDWSFKG